jgi:hypothetical protein
LGFCDIGAAAVLSTNNGHDLQCSERRNGRNIARELRPLLDALCFSLLTITMLRMLFTKILLSIAEMKPLRDPAPA